MAACRLASKGKTMADSSYNLEVQNILSFLKMQHMNRDTTQFIEPITTDINPECLVSPRYLKKYKNKQVSGELSHNFHISTLSKVKCVVGKRQKEDDILSVVMCVSWEAVYVFDELLVELHRAAFDASQMGASWHRGCLAMECNLSSTPPPLHFLLLFLLFLIPTPLCPRGNQDSSHPNHSGLHTVELLMSDWNRYLNLSSQSLCL